MTLPDLAAQTATFMCAQLGKQQVSEQERAHTGDVKISHCVWILMASEAFLTKANWRTQPSQKRGKKQE